MTCVCTPTQQVQIARAPGVESGIKSVQSSISSQTTTFSPHLTTIAARMCAWAAPEYGVAGETRYRTAEYVALAAVYASVIALNTYIQNQNYKIARAYTNLSQDKWQRFKNAYASLEKKLIAEAQNTPEPSPDYVNSRTRANSAVNYAFNSAKETMTQYAKKYALCVDETLDLANSQALMCDDTSNFNYRDAEHYKDYLSDKRWNRRSDILNLGRNNFPTAYSYAQHASTAMNDVANAVVGVGNGLSGLIGYLFNRNETVYPAQFSMAANYGNGAVAAGSRV